MDRITQSLQAYLKSAKIKYQTLFNSDTGNKMVIPLQQVFMLGTQKILVKLRTS